jgi:preprotein translocase subunit YajC
MNSNGAFSLLIFALPLALLGWLFYSQNKRMRQVREFSSALNIGDPVVTSSGLYGTIRHLDDTSAWLEVAEGTTLRFDRRAIAMKQSDTAGSAGAPGSAGSIGMAADAGTYGAGTDATRTDAPRTDATGTDEATGTTSGSSQTGQ